MYALLMGTYCRGIPTKLERSEQTFGRPPHLFSY